jgi:uncharacterized protein (TIGR04255 family)
MHTCGSMVVHGGLERAECQRKAPLRANLSVDNNTGREFMYAHETFPNAPIIEAAADFLVEFDPPLKQDALSRFGESAKGRFPISRERRSFTTSVEIKEEEPIFRNNENRFLAFSSLDEKYLAQVRRDGFGFSRLRPYISWTDFADNSLSSWQIYRDTFSAERISRISLRYANRIDLPNPASFEEYFRTKIQIAPEIPQEASDAMFSFAVTQRDTGDIGKIVSFVNPISTTRDVLSVSLIVEASRQHIEGYLDNEQIRKALEDLRDLKNLLFFCSITEKTKGMFR